jgi:hypothetical protein
MTGVNKNISLVLGAQRGDAEREAGSELVRARQSPAQAPWRKRASLYQPVVLRIADNAAAVVMLSVSRGG